MHWMLAFVTGGWLVHPPHSLFDNTPLWNLLREQLCSKVRVGGAPIGDLATGLMRLN